ncbi:hypothetical protein DFJ73DRAFT_763347 [Zopfochytrium polystomum]|nr:hypothetical protein DFJ73DRAFT_763347 [Zopfochytrium polystomum]
MAHTHPSTAAPPLSCWPSSLSSPSPPFCPPPCPAHWAKPPLPKGARQSAMKEKMKESAALHQFNESPKIGGGSPVIETKFGGPINPQKPPKEQKPAKAVPERQRLPGERGPHHPRDISRCRRRRSSEEVEDGPDQGAASGIKNAAKAGVSAAGKVLKVAGTVAMGPGSYAAKGRKKR